MFETLAYLWQCAGLLLLVLFFLISYLGLWREVIYWVRVKLEKLWWK